MRYWCVIQRSSDGSYYYGYPCDGKERTEDEALQHIMMGCESVGDKLCLMVQMGLPFLPIINQVYPFEATDETRELLARLLHAVNL